MENKLEHVCLTRWRKRIDRAAERGDFTDHEVFMAGNWNACAVGEARHLVSTSIRREYFGPYDVDNPTDDTLDNLGSSFAEYVASNQFKKARNCIDRIEKRLDRIIASNRKVSSKTRTVSG